MANNAFVTKVRKVLHVRPSTTVGSLFGKKQKEQKSVKEKLRRILHLGHRVRTRDLASKVTTVHRESAGRLALDLPREVKGSGNIDSTTDSNRNEATESHASEVEHPAQALTLVLKGLPIPQQTPGSGPPRRSVNEERRMIASKYPIDPIPELPRMMGQSQVTQPSTHGSEHSQDIPECSTTPPSSPPRTGIREHRAPRRHMVDENGHDVTDGHPYFSIERDDTLIDKILSVKNRSSSTSGSSDDDVDWAEVSSGTAEADNMGTQSNIELESSHAFCNPSKTGAIENDTKTPAGLWARFAAAKYGVVIPQDQDPVPEFDLLSAGQLQAAKEELQASVSRRSIADRAMDWPDQAPGTKYDIEFRKAVQVEKGKFQSPLVQGSIVKHDLSATADQAPAALFETPIGLVQYPDLIASIVSPTPSNISSPASKDHDSSADSAGWRRLAKSASNPEGLSLNQLRAAELELLDSMNQAPEAGCNILTPSDQALKMERGVSYATPKDTCKSRRFGDDEPSRLLLRKLAINYNASKDKMLMSPETDPFRDSGYVTPSKPGDGTPTGLHDSGEHEELVLPKTPANLEPPTATEDLSLALIPTHHTEQGIEALSPNEVENLTIDFANRAMKYLDLGLDYMVEQSNIELHAQRIDRNSAYINQIAVNISDILSRVALMRPHIEGTPAVSRTREFEAPAAAVEVDDHIFLNLPDEEKACVLRIGIGKDGRVAHYLNLMIPVRGFDSRMEELTIVSQMDVTSVVEQLALQEYDARSKSTKSAISLEPKRDIWIEQSEIEEAAKPTKSRVEPYDWFDQSFEIKGVLKRALTDTDKEITEKPLGLPTTQMRRLLSFFLKLGSEHQECAVFAGKKPPGWEDFRWQTYWVTRDVRENEEDDNLRYEKAIDEYMWSQIQYKLDDDWSSFVWRDTISWGKDSEQRRAYFIPMADRWSADEEDREKWWLMFLSDFDEDAWAKERFV